jgi:hypothetical protein
MKANLRRFVLGAALAAGLSSLALAQDPISGSHRLLDDAPPSAAAAEQAMANRLRQLHDSRELHDLAKRFLEDPGFRRRLQANLKPGEFQGLMDKVRRGEGLPGDLALPELLKQAERIKPEEADRMRQLADKLKPPEPPAGPATSLTQRKPSQPMPKQSSQPPPPPPPPAFEPQPSPEPPRSPWAQIQEESSSWFKERMADLPEKLADWLNAIGDGTEGDALRQALRALSRGEEKLPFGLSDRARELAESVSGLKDYMPQGVSLSDFRTLFEDVHLPSPPKVGMPSVHFQLPEGGDGVGPWWMWVLLLGVLGFVLWKASASARRARSDARGWRLGPWPVAPGAVSTRNELVAAFEYLALLCLGPAARARHHLDLAANLAERGRAADPERRRRAAEELARLYEQARYTPDDELLTPEDLAAARRDLCFLAGVAAA